MKRLNWYFRAIIILGALTGFAGLAFTLKAQDAASDLLKTADETLERVARLRGLQPKSPIEKGVKNREEISKFLEAHVRENYEEGQILSEGRMLQKLGMIPPDLDYKGFTLKLLTEQVGGYYDPDERTFFIAGWLPAEQQKPVMAHELTHALQDQYFNIGRLIKEERKLRNDDRVLARQAVFEGDAMAVMLDYLLEPAGRNFAQLPNLVFVMRSQFTSMEAQFEVFKQAPLFLKEELLFPYGYGAAFLQKIRSDQTWEAVNKVYSDLPLSTEQIIHPDKYLGTRDNPKPVDVQDPSPILGSGWKSGYTNVLGEFALYLMLQLHIPEEKARRAAAGWGGDQVVLAENPEGSAAVFCYSVWDTPEDAEEFFQAMSEWLKSRFPKAGRSGESASSLSLKDAGEFHTLRRSEDRVNFIVGLPEAQSAKFKNW